MEKRNIKTFEPDEDVATMLDRAVNQGGLRLKHVLNESAREWLKKKGFARKRELAKEAA